MIVIDGSSFVALTLGEKDSVIARTLAATSEEVFIAHATAFETTLAFMGDHGIEGVGLVRRMIKETGLVVVPTTEVIRLASLEVYNRFGAERVPEAELTMGDCASVALASSLNARLVSETNKFGWMKIGGSDASG